MAKTALYQLSSIENLRAVWKEYKSKAKNSAAGINGLSPKQFDAESLVQISLLSKAVREGYSHSSLRAVAVPKKDPNKFRVICIPTIQDRIVQRAILRVIEARGERLRIINEVSFGFVKDGAEKKRGTSVARDTAVRYRQVNQWAFKADISSFFDRIERSELGDKFHKAFSLKSLMPLVADAISCEVDVSDSRIARILSANGVTRGQGLRQGMPLSPILSNFLLRDFDRAFMKRKYKLVRYADDLLVLASSRAECEEIKAFTEEELGKLNLTLSSDKTVICEPTEAVEFLGMELGLATDASTYCLTISEQQMSKIKEQFSCFRDVNYTVGKNLNVFSLSRRLANMTSGYKIAYGLANNYNVFNTRLSQWNQNCMTKIYSNIFGAENVNKLTNQQRLFLMLDYIPD